MIERCQADEALDAAVQQWAEVYGLVEPGDVITDYVFGLAAQRFEHASNRARYAWGSRHNAMPLHHVLGLLDVTTLAVKAAGSDEDGWIDP